MEKPNRRTVCVRQGTGQRERWLTDLSPVELIQVIESKAANKTALVFIVPIIHPRRRAYM